MTKIKDTKTALSVFEEAATKHAEATQQGDYKTCNKVYAIIVKSINFLREHNEEAALMTFLDHNSVGVRSWAATYLLPIREDEAVQVLEDLVKRADIFSLDAETTLSEWRKGNLKL